MKKILCNVSGDLKGHRVVDLLVSKCYGIWSSTGVFSLNMFMVAGFLDDHVLHCDSVTVCVLTCIQPHAVPMV
jgi:hypothetical protein